MVESPSQPLTFGTLVTAMVTPFTVDGDVDLDATAALANKLVEDGCDGLVLSGTTGESSTLDDTEKLDVFRVVAQTVSGRAKVIAGTGSNHTSHSVELAQKAEKLGIDGHLLVTPYYLKPTQAGIQAHFEAVAAVCELPIMLYDIPGRAGVPITSDTICRLAENPRITALKDAKADYAATTYVMSHTDLDVYSGDDGLTLPLMAAGAVGLVSVSAHVITARFRALVDACRANDFASARKIHFELDPVIRATMTHVPGAVAAKQILAWQGVLPTATVRLPHVRATDAEITAIRADLADAGWSLGQTTDNL